MRFLLPVATILALCACRESGDGPAASLHFTAIPGDNVTELAGKFLPLERHLSEKLGVTVKYIPTTDYTASVEAFLHGNVHLAWFGGLTGLQARRKVPGARAIAQGGSDPQYHTYFIAHKDSGLARTDDFPADLAGRKFTFGSSGSTSGRLMPEHFIRKFTGKPPADFFGREMHFSGSHENTARLVETGTFEAGAIDFKTYDRLVKEKKVDPDACRIIWKSPPYADYNWTAHPDLEKLFGAGFTDRLQAALLEIRDPALLAAINRPEGLIPAKNEEWDELAAVARELGLIR
jgi:phosphonate transport system substrate-binding protein